MHLFLWLDLLLGGLKPQNSMFTIIISALFVVLGSVSNGAKENLIFSRQPWNNWYAQKLVPKKGTVQGMMEKFVIRAEVELIKDPTHEEATYNLLRKNGLETNKHISISSFLTLKTENVSVYGIVRSKFGSPLLQNEDTYMAWSVGPDLVTTVTLMRENSMRYFTFKADNQKLDYPHFVCLKLLPSTLQQGLQANVELYVDGKQAPRVDKGEDALKKPSEMILAALKKRNLTVIGCLDGEERCGPWETTLLLFSNDLSQNDCQVPKCDPPCKKGGICRPNPNPPSASKCYCPFGMEGKSCELKPKNTCKSWETRNIKCENGGTCVDMSRNNSKIANCACQAGYYGDKCQKSSLNSWEVNKPISKLQPMYIYAKDNMFDEGSNVTLLFATSDLMRDLAPQVKVEVLVGRTEVGKGKHHFIIDKKEFQPQTDRKKYDEFSQGSPKESVGRHFAGQEKFYTFEKEINVTVKGNYIINSIERMRERKRTGSLHFVVRKKPSKEQIVDPIKKYPRHLLPINVYLRRGNQHTGRPFMVLLVLTEKVEDAAVKWDLDYNETVDPLKLKKMVLKTPETRSLFTEYHAFYQKYKKFKEIYVIEKKLDSHNKSIEYLRTSLLQAAPGFPKGRKIASHFLEIRFIRRMEFFDVLPKRVTVFRGNPVKFVVVSSVHMGKKLAIGMEVLGEKTFMTGLMKSVTTEEARKIAGEDILAGLQLPKPNLRMGVQSRTFRTAGTYTMVVTVASEGQISHKKDIFLTVIAPMSEVKIFRSSDRVGVGVPFHVLVVVDRPGNVPEFEWTFGKRTIPVVRRTLDRYTSADELRLLSFFEKNVVKQINFDSFYDVVEHTFSSEGNFSCRLMTKNTGLVHQSIDFNMTATFQPKEVHLVTSSGLMKNGTTTYVAVIVMEKGKDTEFYIEIGRGLRTLIYLNKFYSRTTKLERHFGFSLELTERLNTNGFFAEILNITQDKLGEKKITLTVMEKERLLLKRILNLFPVEAFCDNNVTLVNAGDSYETAVEYGIEDTVHFAMEGLIACDHRDIPKRSWSVFGPFISPPGKMRVLDRRVKFSLPVTTMPRNKATFHIPPGLLTEGIYIVKMKMKVNQGGIKTLSEGMGWFKVHSKNYRVHLSGGEEITHLFSKPLLIDAVVSSYNRSEDKVKWLCNLNPQVINSPCEGFHKVVSNTGTRLTFPSDTFQPQSIIGVWFIIESEDKKNPRKEEAKQLVRISSRGSMNILCRRNCRQKVNPFKELQLEGKSPNLADMVFNWEVELEKSGNRTAKFANKECEKITRNEAILIIKPHCFIQGVEYSVKLTGSSVSYTLSAMYKLLTNEAPWKGKCRVFPQSGEALKTRFNVHCKGFRDNDQPISYNMVYDNQYDLNAKVESDMDLGLTSGVMLKRRYSPVTQNLVMPAGNPRENYLAHITVVATDSYGMSVSVNLTVTVKALDIKEKEFQRLVESGKPGSVEDVLLIEGDVEGALDMAISAAKILKSGELPYLNLDKKTNIRSNLMKVVNKVQLEDFGKAVEVVTAIESIVEIPQEMEPESAEVAVEKLKSVALFLEENTKDESLDPSAVFETAVSCIKAAASLYEVSSVLDRTPTLLPDGEKKLPLTKEKLQLCSASSSAVEVIERMTDLLMEKVEMDADRFLRTLSVVLFVRRARPSSEKPPLGRKEVAMATIPPLNVSSEKDDLNNMIAVKAAVYPSNPYPCSKMSDYVNTFSLNVQLDKVSRNGKSPIKSFHSYGSEPVRVSLKRKGNPESVKSKITADGLPHSTKDNVKLHFLNLTAANSTAHIFLERSNMEFSILLAWTYKYPPKTKDFRDTDFVVSWSHPERRMLTLHNRRRGIYYVGLVPYTEEVREALGRPRDGDTFDPEKVGQDLDYNITLFVSRCLIHEGDEWKEEGCKVTEETTIDAMTCECQHLSVIAGSFLVAPSRGDSTHIPGLFDRPSRNWIVLVSVILLWLLFILGLMLAFRMDNRMAYKNRLIFLDNPTRHKGYIIMVRTGFRKNSTTTSQVSVKLHLGQHVSRDILLCNKDYEAFQKGQEDWFYFMENRHFMDLDGLTVYVQFQGDRASWFLDQIKIRDLRSRKEWVFLVNEWFIPKEQEKVEEFYVPLTPCEMRGFKALWKWKAKRDMRIRYLWFSLVSFPPRTHFNRVQRLATAFSAYLLSVYLTTAQYEDMSEELDPTTEEDGIRWTQAVVALYSSFLALFYEILMVELFLKIEKPENHLLKAEAKKTATDNETEPRNNSEAPSSWSSQESIAPPPQPYPVSSDHITDEPHRRMDHIFSSREHNFSVGNPSSLPSTVQRRSRCFGDGLFDSADMDKPRPMMSTADFRPLRSSDVEETGQQMRWRPRFLSRRWSLLLWAALYGTSLTCTAYTLLYGVPFEYGKRLGWLLSNVFAITATVLLWQPLYAFLSIVVLNQWLR